MYEDEPEIEDKENNEDEWDYEENDGYDDYDLEVGTGNKILNYVKSHPWKIAGLLSLFAITRGVVSGTYDTLRSPSSKTWDEITNELITKHLVNKEQNKTKAFNTINDEDKMITIINILRDISDKMASMCKFLGPFGTVKPSIKNTITALKDITYYKIMGNYKETEETLVRKGIERNNWMCYYVAVTLKKCCDKLGLKSTIAMNYTGHTFLLVKSPVTFTYHNDTLKKKYKFSNSETCAMEAGFGECCKTGTSYFIHDNEEWYNTDIIFGKHNHCYRLTDTPDDNDTSKGKKVFVRLSEMKEKLFNTIIDGDENAIAKSPNIKTLPMGTKPLNYNVPASYIDMLRQP